MPDDIVLGYLIELWVVIIFLLLVFGIICFCTRSKKSMKPYRRVVAVVFAFILSYGAYKTVLGVMDLVQKDYVVETDVEYSRYYRRQVIDDPIGIRRADGSSFNLVGGTEDYPYGEYYGTVTYSKRCKIIIGFKGRQR